MIVQLQPDAIADLEQIGDHIARDNPQRALSFVRELRTSCLELGDMPRAFPLVPGYADRGVRYRVQGNYLIFYRVVDEVQRVDVLRVLHGARDYGDVLL